MHIAVLYQEVLEYLQPHPGGAYIDGTVGAGGHSRGILINSAPDGRVLAFDRDPDAISFAQEALRDYADRITFIHGSYHTMATLAVKNGFNLVDGVMLDLGLSSRQLADDHRGFSFLHDGPLDMRFDPTSGLSAAELVNDLGEEELTQLLWRYGEIRQSRKYARAIIRQRPLETTAQLADLIAGESGRQYERRGRGRHPATRVFQALRIAVNEELPILEEGLRAAVSLLKPGARLAVISFHSLEDRIVKQFIRRQSSDCECPADQPVCTCNLKPALRPITRKAVMPTEQEIGANPRSRSARLRVAEKVPGD